MENLELYLGSQFYAIMDKLICYEYKDLQKISNENIKLKDLEKEFADYGSINKLAVDLKTNILISNQDIQDNQDNLTIGTIKDKGILRNIMQEVNSEKSFSENGCSPTDLSKLNADYPSKQKLLGDRGNIRKYSGHTNDTSGSTLCKKMFRRATTTIDPLSAGLKFNLGKSTPKKKSLGAQDFTKFSKLKKGKLNEIIKSIKNVKNVDLDQSMNSKIFNYTDSLKEVLDSINLEKNQKSLVVDLLFHQDPNLCDILDGFKKKEYNLAEIRTYVRNLVNKYNDPDTKASKSMMILFKDCVRFAKELDLITDQQESSYLYLYREDHLGILCAYESFKVSPNRLFNP